MRHTHLHPLWNVHLWVSESPSSCNNSLFQDLGCAAFSFCIAVQGPCTMQHWIIVSQRLQASKACLPAWDTEQSSNYVGHKSLVGLAAAGPTRALIYVEIKGQQPRASKHTCDKNQESRENQRSAPYAKNQWEHLPTSCLKSLLSQNPICPRS